MISKFFFELIECDRFVVKNMDNEGAWNWITDVISAADRKITLQDLELLVAVYKTLRTRPVRQHVYTDADVQDFRMRVNDFFS